MLNSFSMPLRKSEKCTYIVSAGPFDRGPLLRLAARRSAVVNTLFTPSEAETSYKELHRRYPWRLEGKGLGIYDDAGHY
jgi:hypothetical protein